MRVRRATALAALVATLMTLLWTAGCSDEPDLITLSWRLDEAPRADATTLRIVAFVSNCERFDHSVVTETERSVGIRVVGERVHRDNCLGYLAAFPTSVELDSPLGNRKVEHQ